MHATFSAIRLAILVGFFTAFVSVSTAQPVRLVFKTQPSDAAAGVSISPAIAVEVRKANNDIDSLFVGAVQLSLHENPGGGTLSGSTNVLVLEGVAVFSDVNIDKTGSGYTLRVQTSGAPFVYSNTFTILPGPPDEIIKISGDNQSGTVNSSLQEPFIVEVRDRFGNLIPDAGVTFLITDQPAGAGASLSDTSAQTGINGRASTTLMLGNKAGTYSVKASVNDAIQNTFTANLEGFTITGRIVREDTGLPGVVVSATGGHDQSVTTNAGGTYSLTNIPRGATDIRITPSLTGHIFQPASRTIPGPVTDNIAGQNFDAMLLTFSISGTIIKGGSPLAGVTVTAEGGHNQTVSTNSSGQYVFTRVIFGSSGITITPTFEAHNFLPTQRIVSDPVVGDITGMDFSAFLNMYTISGTVSGDTQENVTITVTGDLNRSIQTTANGNFSISNIAHGSGITITPTKEGFSFVPASRTLSNITSDRTGQNFAAIRWKLAFERQPSTAKAGEAITPSVAVKVIDFDEDVVRSFSGQITISIHTNPAGGTLHGTTRINAVEGMATFPDLNIRKTGMGYTLRATSIGFEQVISSTFDITPGPPANLFIISGDNQKGAIHTPLADPFYVGVGDQFDNLIAGVTVSFSISSQPENAGASLSPESGITDAQGQTSTRLTPGSKAGTYEAQAAVPGLAPVTFTSTVVGYSISGVIRDDDDTLPGVTVTASGGYNQVVETDSNGIFEITNVPEGTEKITITPALDGYGFLPASVLIVGPVQNNIEDVSFSATSFTYTLTGKVFHNGIGLQGVSITAEGGHSSTVVTNENGDFTFTNIAHGAREIVITPRRRGYTFTPASLTIEGPVTENIRTNDIRADILTFSVSGRITRNNIGLQGITVSTAGTYTNSVQTRPDGYYEFTNVPFETTDITITPSRAGYLFDPDKTTIDQPVTDDIRNIDFITIPPGPPTLAKPENNATDIRFPIELSWLEVPGATSYGLEVSKDAAFIGQSDIFIPDLETTSYIIEDLDRGRTYFWRVNAINLGGSGLWSDVWSFTTTETRKSLTIISPAEGDAWKENELHTIRWGAVDIELIKIEYRSEDELPWIIIDPSVNAEAGSHNWQVPQSSSMQSRIKLTDITDTSFFSISDHFIMYPAKVQVEHSLTFGNADEITSYRMVGFPGNRNLPLSDILSGTPRKDWTAYLDNGQPANYLLEYDGSERFTFTPGRGFWILSKSTLHIQDETEHVTLDTDNTYPIPLHDGWNIISNPFHDSVSWNDIRQINQITELLWEFNNQYRQSEQMVPFRGYYFFNRTGLNSLKIPYPPAVRTSTKTDDALPGSRILTLSLIHGDGESNPVHMHFVDTEKENIDKFRKYAPPGDFEEVSIVIQNTDLSTAHTYLVEDVTDETGGGSSFLIELVSRSKEASDLRIEGLEAFPDYRILLIERNTGKRYDIRDSILHSILSGVGKREFVLLIGSDEYIQGHNSLHPKEFHLSNNYPNPFNPATTIEYSIPAGHTNVPVTLDIYNILGQKIRSLVNDVQSTGFYMVKWDGKNDHGETVASGLYICEIRADNFIDRKRMIFLR
jgi:hypothetical protein